MQFNTLSQTYDEPGTVRLEATAQKLSFGLRSRAISARLSSARAVYTAAKSSQISSYFKPLEVAATVRKPPILLLPGRRGG